MSSSAGTMHALPFGPKDLLVDADPGECTSTDSAVRRARCRNWALGQWYRDHLVKTDAGDQTLVDLETFTRNERMQLVVAGAGLGAVVAGVGIALFR